MKETSYKEKLNRVNTFILDFDGVLTDGTVFLMPPSEFIRTMHVRDSFAIQFAVKKGYNIAVITGGNNTGVRDRMQYLGVTDVFLQVHDKIQTYEAYKKEKNLEDDQILYMGDDIPDHAVMKKAGLAICPNDAAEEIKAISHYISPLKGGEGCVRDIIEQVMKLHGKWVSF